MAASNARRRSRGEIETRPGGSLRVRVYAGIDPITNKRLYLTETVPAGPKAARRSRKFGRACWRRSTTAATRGRARR